MGLNTTLPDNVLRLMDPSDRQALGGANALTSSEAQRKWQKGEEKKMHETFSAWLGHHPEIYWDHSRFDKPTTNRVGHPDYVLQRENRVLNVEMKAPGGVLTEAQRGVHEWIARTGGTVHVCYSAEEAIRITREVFKL
jgi:hypothetical protein